jgi:hypothetical protein
MIGTREPTTLELLTFWAKEARKAKAERDRLMVEMHAEGVSLRAIGELVGLSHMGVSHIVRRAAEAAENGPAKPDIASCESCGTAATTTSPDGFPYCDECNETAIRLGYDRLRLVRKPRGRRSED